MGTGDGPDGGWTTCGTTVGQPALDGWATSILSCDIPASSPPGYLSFRIINNGTVGSADTTCWTANDTALEFETGVAIVQPQPTYTPVVRNVRPNVFGGQMINSAVASAAIGMANVRYVQPWRWAQPADCWNETDGSGCFNWGHYDPGVFALSAAGMEVMINAYETAPAWAAAKNNSGPTWAEFPGPEHYDDYLRFLTLMLNQYGGIASAVEASNEDDGLAFFQPQPIPINETCIPLSLAPINITGQAINALVNGQWQATGNGAGGLAITGQGHVGLLQASQASTGTLKLVGLSSSSFDIKQEASSTYKGVSWGYYERSILNCPGIIQSLHAVSLHPYQNAVWVPWSEQGWGNISFQFPNETVAGENSTVAQLLAVAGFMSDAAAAAGMQPYAPVLWPSEWGYNLMASVPLYDGWANMHAALVAQGLINMRSAPRAQYVAKSFYFAASDGCCEESVGFFGLWRPHMARLLNTTLQPGQMPRNIQGGLTSATPAQESLRMLRRP